MKIQNNRPAATALRYTTANRNALAKSLEKLSSGYAVNRAGDDAAGLAISEKMRLQITGLDRACSNSRDGLSLIQTGEGALEEIHQMLNRAAELAEQSANGTFDNALDRRKLQDELEQLCEEINRIAEGTNFNGINLFQDKGITLEQTRESWLRNPPAPVRLPSENDWEAQASQLARDSSKQEDEVSTLDWEKILGMKLEGATDDGLNIIYVEDAVNATQVPDNTEPSNPACDIDINGKKISEILKTEIVPQTVQNIVKNYSAFSYLDGSTIGIGMKLYSDTASSVLASVRLESSLYPNGKGTLAYTLNVNMGRVDVSDTKWRSKLEATIAHEMIHAFMDEATTAGMVGKLPGTGSLNDVGRFDKWFIEGMAQTASGPDNWVSAALGITESSTDEAIKQAIAANKLTDAVVDTDTNTANQYGTGYLACMYLGAVIGGYQSGSDSMDAATILKGLNRLMRKVIEGTSLDEAIKALTDSKFTSTADFKTQFDTGAAPDMCGFIRNLIKAQGTDGLGGLVSGNLAASDLTEDTPLTDVRLFELDTTASKITNKYPDDYVVLTGGTTSKDGVKPDDYVTQTQIEYGDFIIKGNLISNENGGYDGITWNNDSKTLTLGPECSNVEISMKDTSASNDGNIVIDGMGKVVLNGVKAQSLSIKQNAEITQTGINNIGTISVDTDKKAVLLGDGRIEATTFTNNGTAEFRGGAIIVGSDGTGAIGSMVRIGNALVAADITSPVALDGTTQLEGIGLDWSQLLMNDIASISIDGTKFDAPLDKNAPGKLWLDPGEQDSPKTHRVTFTDTNGVCKTLKAVYDLDAGSFEWQDFKCFTVTGGTEGTDYHYEDDGTTLVISKSGLTISGGVEDGVTGRVRVADNIGTAVELTLDGVNCSQNKTGSGLELGEGNNVTLKLAGGKENKFTGANDHAGISVKKNTSLIIEETADGTGKLTATGGTYAAGIGSNHDAALTDAASLNNSVTINGGNIRATGGNQAAGIGGGYESAFGDIVINGGTVCARGNSMSAGIGGGYKGDINNITINDCEGIDTYASAGVGIGTGTNAKGGDIIMKGGKNIIARGGASAAGIGPDLRGTMGKIEISGGEIQVTSGTRGAAIGAGPSAHVDSIIISGENTTITANGGQDGVGIGTGFDGATCGSIDIKGGVIKAEGAKNSTGIGAGRNSTCGAITIGDPGNPDSRVIVTATGGMTNNGGHIMSYSDREHKTEGSVTITGNNTTVRPGPVGEGLYATTGVTGAGGERRYAYPVYLFNSNPASATLSAGMGLDGLLPLPASVDPDSIQITSSKGDTWNVGMTHNPMEENYVFVWLRAEDQTLTVKYKDENGQEASVDLDLKFHADSGTFRIARQPTPPPAEVPGYDDPPTPPDPDKPDVPGTPATPDTPAKSLEGEGKGIILQIGTDSDETLEIPQFYFSLDALNMEGLNISTQENAWKSMGIIKRASNYVSDIRGTYGALYNRLEHNLRQLQNTHENLTEAESCIRDVDVSKEIMKYTKENILVQSAQAMLAQANQLPEGILQLLQ